MPKKNYYEILEINKTASSEEIKTAYRRLAKKYHPDLNPGKPYASSKFMELDEAYDTLKDPTLKKRYDRTLSDSDFSHNQNKQQQQQQKRKRKTRKSTRRKGPFDEEMRAHNARRKNNNYTSEKQEQEAREKSTHEKNQQKSKEEQNNERTKPKGNWGFWSYLGIIWMSFVSLVAFLGQGHATDWSATWRMFAGLVFFLCILALLYELNILSNLLKSIPRLKSFTFSKIKITNLKTSWKEGGLLFHGNYFFLIAASSVCLIEGNIFWKFIGVIGLLFFGSIYAMSAYFAHKTFFDNLLNKLKTNKNDHKKENKEDVRKDNQSFYKLFKQNIKESHYKWYILLLISIPFSYFSGYADDDPSFMHNLSYLITAFTFFTFIYELHGSPQLNWNNVKIIFFSLLSLMKNLINNVNRINIYIILGVFIITLVYLYPSIFNYFTSEKPILSEENKYIKKYRDMNDEEKIEYYSYERFKD